MIPKFRAWTEEGEVMYYDVYPFKDETVLLSYDEIAFDEVPASDFILMQSTGLKDRNEAEIFDGDIVRFEVPNKEISGIYEVRRANSGEWRIDNEIQGRSLYISGSYNCEVIGNIYEDKHLLEEE